MKRITPQPLGTINALVTVQGTAMPETALCDAHVDEQWYPQALTAAMAADDWDGTTAMHDCTGNDMLTCIACGRGDT